jgi:hypothetical protein
MTPIDFCSGISKKMHVNVNTNYGRPKRYKTRKKLKHYQANTASHFFIKSKSEKNQLVKFDKW